MDNQLYKTLIKYGLSENEIKVYLEALKHDLSSPFQLSKATGIPRTTVYDVITDLSLKKLIEIEHNSLLEKKQTKIKARNPSVLRTLIQEQQKKLSKLEVDIVDILPELHSDFHEGDANADFKFYPGIDGAKKVMFSETHDIELPMYIWTQLLPMDTFGRKTINESVSEQLKLRKNSKALQKKLLPLTDWTKHVLSYQYQRDPEYIKLREIRYIDNPIFDINIRIVLQADTTRITSAHENEAWGLVMKSKPLFESLSSIFLLGWHSATPVTDEFVQSLGKNNFFEAEKKK